MSDETDNPFQSEASSASPSTGSAIFIPIAIALLGVVLGGVALFLTMSGSGKSEATQSALEEATEQTTALELRLNGLEQQLAKLQSSFSDQDQKIRVMASQTQSALNQVGQEINSSRQQITATAAKVNEIAEKMQSAVVARAPARASLPPQDVVAAEESEQSSATAVLPNGSSIAKHREHVISGGDTFAKLSKKYQVSVDEILAANPDADPRRLQVGQRIKIPHSSHSRE
ncbi:LysM peptidoglycan-binding domain-containing protein [Rubellicoccus peritrichatus]|uniref:LysM peptidoglycan-binding domain-containing protein n=1 Tax=Rubellicoccus peritrichatus TaxID=3080537 RepID=A0AAQ3L8J0_9BACT|nr:LysM peptidoglycan-binding domain-containing protein [Puniceicoccus sp. CR14]WOO40826.1 LysM peptidoglycan-binding domain-containing protein [Puniceicoccus sp. CR14]